MRKMTRDQIHAPRPPLMQNSRVRWQPDSIVSKCKSLGSFPSVSHLSPVPRASVYGPTSWLRMQFLLSPRCTCPSRKNAHDRLCRCFRRRCRTQPRSWECAGSSSSKQTGMGPSGHSRSKHIKRSAETPLFELRFPDRSETGRQRRSRRAGRHKTRDRCTDERNRRDGPRDACRIVTTARHHSARRKFCSRLQRALLDRLSATIGAAMTRYSQSNGG